MLASGYLFASAVLYRVEVKTQPGHNCLHKRKSVDVRGSVAILLFVQVDAVHLTEGFCSVSHNILRRHSKKLFSELLGLGYQG